MAKAKAPQAPYKHQEFPKVKYGPGGVTQTVADAKAEKALGKGWYDNPADAPKAKGEAKAKVETETETETE